MKKYLMFDVESVGLHGTGFAVGAVVHSEDGTILEQFELLSLEGKSEAQKLADGELEEAETPYNRFFTKMLPKLGSMETCVTNHELRAEFYKFLKKWIDNGAEIWSDCNFPVETNFLSGIVNDFSESEKRTYGAITMPYPLNDLAVVFDVNVSRAASCHFVTRVHHPVDDARASMYHLLRIKAMGV